MTLTKTQKIIISIIILIILVMVYLSFDKKSRNELEQYKNTDNIEFSTTTDGFGVQSTGGYKIEQVSMDEGMGVPKPIPDLTRKVVFGNNVSLTSEVKEMVTKKITGLQAELIKKPEYYGAWIDLGIYQKMAGDYEGAVISWNYASRLAPTDYIALGNLGNLYAYFLKDNAMAENYYKEALTKGPTQVYLYTQLAEVYRDVFKDVDKAKTIIELGLSKIPNDPSLLQFKSSLQ